MHPAPVAAIPAGIEISQAAVMRSATPVASKMLVRVSTRVECRGRSAAPGGGSRRGVRIVGVGVPMVDLGVVGGPGDLPDVAEVGP